MHRTRDFPLQPFALQRMGFFKAIISGRWAALERTEIWGIGTTQDFLPGGGRALFSWSSLATRSPSRRTSCLLRKASATTIYVELKKLHNGFLWGTIFLVISAIQHPAVDKGKICEVHQHADGSLELYPRTMLGCVTVTYFLFFLDHHLQVSSGCSEWTVESITTGLLSYHLSTHTFPSPLVAEAKAPLPCFFMILSSGNFLIACLTQPFITVPVR